MSNQNPFGDLSGLMEQARGMQDRMKKLQEEAGQKITEASSGGGMVSVKVNGKQEVLEIRIDPQAVDPRDVGMLEDLVMSAVNMALHNARQDMAQEMAKLTGGINIPGLF
jgi:nucleoid-associated protein EbfC